MRKGTEREGLGRSDDDALSLGSPSGSRAQLNRVLALVQAELDVSCAYISVMKETGAEILAHIGMRAPTPSSEAAFAEEVMRADDLVTRGPSAPDARVPSDPAGAPDGRFWAGVPLRSADRAVRGALCCVDGRPRARLSDDEESRLSTLGEIVSDLIALQRAQRAAAAELGERDTIERRLRNSERRTRLIIHESGEGFISIDGHSRIREWNRRAEEIFGWGRDEVIGAKLTETIIPAKYRAAHLAGIERFMATGEGRVLFRPTEVTALHRDGQEFPIEINVWPVQVGEESTFHAFVRDITERKQIEEANRQAKEAAEAADRAKSEFLSRMSHELRTPLNAILGFSQLLEMDDLTAEQLDSLAEIRKGGRHLLNLINEVLDIARIESGRLSLSIEPVYLFDVVCHALGLMRSLAASAGISIEVDEPSLRRFVSGDHQRLNQVLLNLFSNAIKYNRPGGSVRVRAHEDHEGSIHLDVTDTGLGISADEMDRLFTPFDRLGAEQSTVEGSGLGLALSRTLVEAMGGEILASPRDEGGMTFTVVLAPAASQLGDLSAVEPDVSEDLPVVRLNARYTMLCIEDNLSNLKLIEQTLGRDSDLQLLTAIQGGMGLQLAREHVPDLILLDLHLPDMTGADVLRQLVEDPRTSEIPVIIVSADATDRQIRRLLEAGAHAYVTKPLDLVELRGVVERAVAGPALHTAAEGDTA